MRTFKHFSYNDRLRLEAFLIAKMRVAEIAKHLHKNEASVYREIKRGRYFHKNTDWTFSERYSADLAEKKYREFLKAKGGELKIGNDYKLVEYIENRIIKDKYSPAAVLGEIKHKKLAFKTSICVTTLYSYIDKGIFLNLTNKNLCVKGQKKRRYQRVEQKRRTAGESIENRPKEIINRLDFGHWEMDCVEGKKKSKKALLVLSERKTRKEIVIPLKKKNSESVVNALDGIEKNYRKLFKKIFKTITVDNGSEFAAVELLERSIFGNGKRTNVYYCHPYSAFERGTNENSNKLVRRKYPKGTDFSKISNKELNKLNDFINNYPRKLFNYGTSEEKFNKEIALIL